MNSSLDASTAQLVAAAEGDLDAFGDFYDANAEDLLRYFYRRTACPETAADLTAETFATALESLGKFRPERGSGRAWLYGVARNKLNRFLRWRRVDTRSRTKLGMRAPVDLDAQSRERIEEDDYIGRLAGRLNTALDGMSPRLADAVRLRVGANLRYEQVAERLGCSQEAARARVARGLKTLGERFEEETL
ncbi:MAG: RNA polymerase sigma factor [Acidimicrobiia bacterium]